MLNQELHTYIPAAGFYKVLNQELIMTNTPVSISVMLLPLVSTDKVSFLFSLHRQANCLTCMGHGSNICGGASEESVATLTDYVDGARDIYVRQALGVITPRACAKGAETAFFEIHFYRERKLWKKRSLALEWARTWV